jgi:hypothetical protein
MSEELSEALLEMHFYRPLVDLFEGHFGRRVLKILKPTQNREAFLGFDVAWVHPSCSNDTVTRINQELKEFIAQRTGYVPSVFLGYFLQFKVVQEMVRKTSGMPEGLNTPYYRAEISMHPNKETGISQHETLLRLSKLRRTDVSYACPMLFVEDELHEEPTVDMVRFVSVDTAPLGYNSNERHFLAFQDKNSEPKWCSTPVPATARSAREWVHTLTEMTAAEMSSLVRATQGTIAGDHWRLDRYRLPYALTLVALGESIDGTPRETPAQ